MKRFVNFWSFFLVIFPTFASADSTQLSLSQIKLEIDTNGQAYSNLKELTDLGHRLSGSIGAEKAVKWAKAKMESYGFENIRLQPVMVSGWQRGEKEICYSLDGNQKQNLRIAALGGSVGTQGIEAEVVEVKKLSDVDTLGSQVKGKIVFYNKVMNPNIDPFEAYGEAVDVRGAGPSRAAKYGAVGIVIRTLTNLADDDHPHTGGTRYDPAYKKIPAGALSTHAANILSLQLKNNPHLKLHIELSANDRGLVPSYNVMGELVGKELPKEIVVVGGHLDSWDLGTGAQDDGAGVVQSLEVLRAFQALKIQPHRTLRAVLFMAEEQGGIGAKEYAKQASALNENHVAAIESDRGGFAPRGFTIDSSESALNSFLEWKKYLEPFQTGNLSVGESGTDVGFLIPSGTMAFGYIPDATHYFDYHHAENDRFEAVNRKELTDGTSAMAALSYLLTEKEIPRDFSVQ